MDGIMDVCRIICISLSHTHTSPLPAPPSRCDTDETPTGEIRFAAPWGSTPAAAVLHTYQQIHTNELKHTPIHANTMIVHAQRGSTIKVLILAAIPDHRLSV